MLVPVNPVCPCRSAEQRAALFFKVLDLLVDQLFGNVEPPGETGFAKERGAAPVDEFFGRADLVEGQFPPAASADAHLRSTTFARNTAQS